MYDVPSLCVSDWRFIPGHHLWSLHQPLCLTTPAASTDDASHPSSIHTLCPSQRVSFLHLIRMHHFPFQCKDSGKCFVCFAPQTFNPHLKLFMIKWEVLTICKCLYFRIRNWKHFNPLVYAKHLSSLCSPISYTHFSHKCYRTSLFVWNEGETLAPTPVQS